MVSGVLNTLWNDLYKVVVGKFYSPATLGQYSRACQFSALFSSNLTNVIQRVTYPVLSNIQNDKVRMVAGYRRIIKVTMFVTAICMFFVGAVSEPLIFCLIGPKWHEAATYLPILCIGGSLYPLHAINLNMLQIQGRSDLYLGLEIVKKNNSTRSDICRCFCWYHAYALYWHPFWNHLLLPEFVLSWENA